MFFNVIFTIIFAILLVLLMYLSINEKMDAQPWKFLVLAFVPLIALFWFQSSFEFLDSYIKERNSREFYDDIKRSLVLINTVVGAFAGALFSVAVTNRAKQLNLKGLNKLKEREAACKELFKEAEIIKTELNNQNVILSGQEIMQKHKLRMRLLDDYITEMNDIRKEEKSLCI